MPKRVIFLFLIIAALSFLTLRVSEVRFYCLFYCNALIGTGIADHVLQDLPPPSMTDFPQSPYHLPQTGTHRLSDRTDM